MSCEIPWDEKEKLLEEVFRREVRHTLALGFQHVYVFGTAAGEVRGEHAHRECHQLLAVVRGEVEVIVDDGERTRLTKLDAPTFDAKSNDVAIESMELRADLIVIAEA